MITLEIRISGGGPAHFSFSSGLMTALHLVPPPDGSGLGVQVGNFQSTQLSISSGNSMENTVMVDITEGADPVWLAFTIDCTQGGSVSVGFPGSPTVRVNTGSYLGLEYNNGNPAPVVVPQGFE
jgi:hypothetical protein